MKIVGVGSAIAKGISDGTLGGYASIPSFAVQYLEQIRAGKAVAEPPPVDDEPLPELDVPALLEERVSIRSPSMDAPIWEPMKAADPESPWSPNMGLRRSQRSTSYALAEGVVLAAATNASAIQRAVRTRSSSRLSRDYGTSGPLLVRPSSLSVVQVSERVYLCARHVTFAAHSRTQIHSLARTRGGSYVADDPRPPHATAPDSQQTSLSSSPGTQTPDTHRRQTRARRRSHGPAHDSSRATPSLLVRAEPNAKLPAARESGLESDVSHRHLPRKHALLAAAAAGGLDGREWQ